jgi:phosphohistidine phosphatase
MRLYLMRHGAAVERHDWDGDDAARPLTNEGRQRTREVVEKLFSTGNLQVDQVWSSPLVRARETAEIVAKVLRLPVRIVPELACGASVATVESVIRKAEPPVERLMLVGHEPDCGVIIGELQGEHEGSYALRKSGVALLEGHFAPKGMTLIWRHAPADVLV